MKACEILQQLIRIPSVNPEGVPGVECPGEEACAQAVGGILGRTGAAVEFQEVFAGRPNVIGRFPANRPGKKRLLFAPHLDTVSIVGMTVDPFGAELRDGRIYGRGASDTKGPMSAMLAALWELRQEIPALPYEIWFAGLIGEEAGQHGAKAFAAAHHVDFALIGEPTGLQIVHTHKGSTWLALETRGKAVHSSAPHEGENAIYKMADALHVVRQQILPQLARHKHPVLGSPTLSVGTISGGTKTNIVPDQCRAELDIRTIPGFDTQWICEALQTAVPDLEITKWESHPMFTDPAHPLIHALEKAGGSCTGAPWFCDAAIFAQAGIPAVAIGPGSIAQAHTRDEWISIEALETGVEFYIDFLRALPAD